MGYTLTQFAYQALRDIGCLRPGQSTSQDVLADILVQAQQMVDSWLIDSMLVPFDRIDTYNLTAGLQTYNIGPGQVAPNFNATRPIEIYLASILLNTVTPVVRKELEIINVESRVGIPVDAIPAAIPLRLYYNKNFDPTLGFASIFLWPGPLATYQLELVTPQQVQNFADLTTSYNFPPGYAKLLRKGLGKTIAPSMRMYAKIPGPGGLRSYDPAMLKLVIDEYQSARAQLEAYNSRDLNAPCDPAWSSSAKHSSYNYYSDSYGSRHQ